MLGKDVVIICYFGEGVVFEGDFYVGLNMVVVLNCLVIFFCWNNGYVILILVEE